MKPIRVKIPGTPVAQGRGRVGRWEAKDGRTGTTLRDPAKSNNWKATAHEHMRRAMEEAGQRPVDGPVRLRILAHWDMSRSRWLKTSKRPAEWKVGKRYDLDNLAKAVMDAGNGVLYLDDGQVVSLRIEKVTGKQGDPAFVEIYMDESKQHHLESTLFAWDYTAKGLVPW